MFVYSHNLHSSERATKGPNVKRPIECVPCEGKQTQESEVKRYAGKHEN